MKMTERLLPTGKCWCGCGADVPIGSFFLSGHDRRAESAVIAMKYGSVVEFLAKHGYAPPSGENVHVAYEAFCKKKDKK